MKVARIRAIIITCLCLVAGSATLAQGNPAQYAVSPAGEKEHLESGREEFNGPFPSWANVKIRFGAKGDGRQDDTRALQEAIDGLSNPATRFNMGRGAYMVLYLPAGTYCISSTLVLKGKIGVSIIGEDPATTVIKWTGGDKDTLLWANGSAYFKIGRLTWDANGRKEMEGIGIHWKNKWNDGVSRSFASLNIEISDCLFTGEFKYGIGGGTYLGPTGTGNNDSEITIRRCLFPGCSGAAILIRGFNALDYWIWDCRFLHCRTGVDCAHGNYHIYHSFFSGSTIADALNDNGYYTSLRGCYSERANTFSYDQGISSNPFKRSFQDNTIISPGQTPVLLYHLGKITLWGNKFDKTRDRLYPYSITTGSWATGMYEVLSLHNLYAYKDPIHIGPPWRRLFSFGDRDSVPVRPAAEAFLKTLDRTPAKVTRRVFEVPAGAGNETIQAFIDQAAVLKGQRPVIHFPMGDYYIDKTLEIPAGSDVQFIGDGLLFASMILEREPVLFGHHPALLVEGPSYITIRDLGIGGRGGSHARAGIDFRNVDQPGGEAHIDQVYSQADTSLFVSGMNWLYVEKDNSFFSSGNYIAGGPLLQEDAGKAEGRGTARVSCYGGQFARLTVKMNGRFLARDCWWEGSERVPLNLEGSGSVSVDGAMIAPAGADSMPTVRIGKFSGNISLMNMYLQGGIEVRNDNPALNLLLWNIHFYHKMDPSAFLEAAVNYRAALLGLSVQCFRTGDPRCAGIICVPDRMQNIRDIGTYLDTQTAQSRESEPQPLKNLAPGVSNIYISRVNLLDISKGIDFSASE
jgi:hypothetical protein